MEQIFKTKEKCKNKIARNNNFDSFQRAIQYTFNRKLLQSENNFINKIIDEAMEEYGKQQWNEAIEVGINSFYPVAKELLVDILSADIIKNKLEKLKK